MKILVDADACPVTRIVLKTARARGIPVILVTDDSHVFEDGWAQIVTVGQGAEAADLALVNRTEPGDIVVTQDYGLAALALAKKAYAINQNGMRYTDGNIEGLLAERHEARKARRAGKRAGGIKKRTAEQDAAFEAEFARLVDGASGRTNS
jgi:uncharacterized protein YaiI (UPF0178 family)